VLGHDQAFGLEKLDGVANGHSGDAVVLDELGFRGEALPFCQVPALDSVTELVSDLPEDGAIAGGIQIAQVDPQVSSHHQHSFARLYV
jgi:hypothetical protein